MICNRCERDVPIENKDTGLCATCNKEVRTDSAVYPLARAKFLELMVFHDARCPIYGTPITLQSDIHHKMGRVGFASKEKREAGISLLLDFEFFLAVSRKGHRWIEDNQDIAIAKGYTMLRSGTHNP